MVALLVLLTFLVVAAVAYLAARKRGALNEVSSAGSALVPIDPSRQQISPGVFYDTGHTWLFLEETGTAKLGITEFARSVIGTIDDVRTRTVGDDVRRGEVILELGHNDRLIEFRAPVDGVLEEINHDVFESRPRPVTDSPAASWIYRIKPADTSALASTMLLGRGAREWIEHEIERLKVFLATIVPRHPALGETMQDGGAPVAGVTEYLDDAGWDKLRERFFG